VRAVGLTPPLGLVRAALALTLVGSACVDPRGQPIEIEPGVRAVAVTLAPRALEGAAPSLRVVGARWLDGTPLVLATGEDGVGAIVRVPVDALRGEDGLPLEDAAALALTPTPGIALPRDVPLSCPWAGLDETIIGPGARCVVPMRARVSRVDAEGEAPDAQLEPLVRSDLWLVDARAPRACGPDDAVRATSRAGRIPLEAVSADDGEDFPLGAWALHPDGVALLADAGRAVFVGADGRRAERVLPTTRILAEAALGRDAGGAPRFLLVGLADVGLVSTPPPLLLVSTATVTRVVVDDELRRRVQRVVSIDDHRWVWVGTALFDVTRGFRSMLELCTLDGLTASCASLLSDAPDGVDVVDFGQLDGGRWMAVTNTGVTLTYDRLPMRRLSRAPALARRTADPAVLDGEAFDGDDRRPIRWAWRRTNAGPLSAARVVGDGAIGCVSVGAPSEARLFHLGVDTTTTAVLACRRAAACDAFLDETRDTLRARFVGAGIEALSIAHAGPRRADASCTDLARGPLPEGLLGFGVEVEGRIRRGDTWAVRGRDGALHIATTTASAPRALRQVHGPRVARDADRWFYPVVLPLDASRAIAVSQRGVVDWLDGATRVTGGKALAPGVFAGVVDHAATNGDAVVAWLLVDVDLFAGPSVEPAPALLRLRVPRGDPAGATTEVIAEAAVLGDGVRAIAELRPGRLLLALRTGGLAMLDGPSGRIALVAVLELGDRRAAIPALGSREERARFCSTRAPLAPRRVGVTPESAIDVASSDVWTGADGAEGIGWVTGCSGRVARVLDLPSGAVRVEGLSLRRPRADGDVGFVQRISRGDTSSSQLRALSPPKALCGDAMFTLTQPNDSVVVRFADLLLEARPLLRAEVDALRAIGAGTLSGDPGWFLHAEPSPVAPLTDEGDPSWLVGGRERLTVVSWAIGPAASAQLRPQWPRPVGPDGGPPETAPAFRRTALGAAGFGRTLWVSFEGGAIVRSVLP
jgi:hypothetical protein